MNERIKELKEQSMEWVPNRVDPDTKIRLLNAEKFAELIVRECIKELRYEVIDTQELRQDKSTDYQVGYEDGMFDASETIKQHFRS